MDSFMNRLRDFGHQMRLGALLLFGAAERHLVTTAYFHAFALIPSYALNLLVAIKDYTYKQDRLAESYAPEIAAVLGKQPSLVTREDLAQAAQTNPVLATAVARNKTKRNIDFIVSSIAVTAAVFTVAALGVGTLGGLLLTLPIFLGTEYVFDKIGKRLTHVDEPSPREAMEQPSLQPRLSGPGQVRYLEELQGNVRQHRPETYIQPARVAAVIAALNPNAPAIDIEALTADLNTHRLRAQEVAFIAFGQSSGVEKLGSPDLTALDRMHEKLAYAQQRLAEAGGQVKQHAANIGHAAVEKAHGALEIAKAKCFRSGNVSCAVPENQQRATEALESQEPAPPAPPGGWANYVGKPPATKAADIVAQRTAQQTTALAT